MQFFHYVFFCSSIPNFACQGISIEPSFRCLSCLVSVCHSTKICVKNWFIDLCLCVIEDANFDLLILGLQHRDKFWSYFAQSWYIFSSFCRQTMPLKESSKSCMWILCIDFQYLIYGLSFYWETEIQVDHTHRNIKYSIRFHACHEKGYLALL